jgi:D-erythronate 2-dehydrogenase
VKVVVTGGAGFVGRRLAERLLARGALAGPAERATEISELLLLDVAPPTPPLTDHRIRFVAGDLNDRALLARIIDRDTASVFHFAAIVSGEAEADTDKGLRVNLDGTRHLLDACRAPGHRPRVVFASSLAVYGGALPPAVDDDMALCPQTSYGTQKAMGELLVNDYSRKGYIDGRALRLPTIVVRPGRPNRAASSWASSILREPLAGRDAICPVTPDTAMAILSPRRLIAALEQLHDLPRERFGEGTLLLPSLTVTAAEMLQALARAGGAACAARVRHEPDPLIQRIVESWPRALVASRARRLGLLPDRDIDEIVAAFIADDLPAQKALAS